MDMATMPKNPVARLKSKNPIRHMMGYWDWENKYLSNEKQISFIG